MKRLCALLLSILLAYVLCACDTSATSTSSTVTFHYTMATIEYEDESEAIVKEEFDAGDRLSDFEYLISQYLSGPTNADHSSPFPEGTKLSHFSIQDNVAHITLTDELASLTGSELTLACACLTLTILDITQAESVKISAESASLNSAEYITMDAGCILLLDSVKQTGR